MWIELPGCAAAWYFHRSPRFPGDYRCSRIADTIIRECARKSSSTAGSNNVKILPDLEQKGEAINEYNVMFVMAPERLTS